MKRLELVAVVAALAVFVLGWMYSAPSLRAANCLDADQSEDPQTLRAHPDPEGIRISWGANPEAMRGYWVYRGTTRETVCKHMAGWWKPDYDGPIDAYWIDLNTEPGQTYWYRVTLYDGARKQIASTTLASARASGQPGGAPGQPGGAPVQPRRAPTPTRQDAPTVTGPSEVEYLETRTDAVANYEITMQGEADISVTLTGVDAADFRFVPSTGDLEFVNQPAYASPADDDENNVYLVTLNATALNLTTVRNVEVTVLDYNHPPVVSGPTTKNVPENTAGVATYVHTDADQDPVSWTLGGDDAGDFQISGKGELTFDPAPDFETPADDDTGNDYEVTVRADDGTNTLVEYPVTVSITDVNEAPEFPGATDSRNVDENTPADRDIGAPVTAIDVDANETLTYSLDTAGAAVFGIDASTGQLKTKAELDHEDTDSYDVTVTVRDRGGLTDSVDVTIVVNDVNDAPEFPDTETGQREVAENTATNTDFGDPVAATDEDEGKLTYTLSGDDGNSFDIDEASGQLRTKDPLDYDTKNSYEVTVTATDPFLASDTITVTITVTEYVAQRLTSSSGGSGGGGRVRTPPRPVNPKPEFDENGPVTITVPENTAVGMAIGDPLTATDADDTDLTYSIVDWKDGSSFDIDSDTGQLKTKAPLDYEKRTQYQLQARVRDDDGGNDRVTVNIRVTGVDEPPELSGDTSISVVENSTGTLATYSATDPEGQNVSWDLSGDDAGDFSIGGGILRFTSTPDHENPADDNGDNVYEVTVQASDGTLASTLDVTVTVTNLVDDFRVRGSSRGADTTSTGTDGSGGSDSALTSLSYPENSTATVATYESLESDGTEIAWSTAGDDGDLFSITGGALSFKAPPDYEDSGDSNGDNAYTVKVQATDGTETVSLDIAIDVTNVNEGPSVTGDSAPHFDEQATGNVATYAGSDPEKDGLNWSLSGDDSGDFSIIGGVLSFSSRPNYEDPADDDSDNVYEVTVVASDGEYSDSLNVSVTVDDIDEVPITNATTQRVALVSTSGPTTVTTPDDVASVTFPSGSRSDAYFVRVDSDSINCAADDNQETADPGDNNLRICLTVESFDTWGTHESDVTLDQPASIAMVLDADDLGGADIVEQAYQADGFAIYTRGGSDDDWSPVDFTLTVDEDDVVNIAITGITGFSNVAASTDDDVFDRLSKPPPTPTPTPTPTPRPETPVWGGNPSSMVAGFGVLRIPHRQALPVAMTRPAPERPDDDAPPETLPAAPEGAVEPVVLGLVEKHPLWALIILIIGSVMFAAGTGMIAVPRAMAPPKWMRVPGAPPIKRRHPSQRR